MSESGNFLGGLPSMPPEPARDPALQAPPPPPVANAVRLMLVRAVLTLLSLLTLFLTKDSLRDAIAKKNSGYDAAKLDTVVNAAIAVGVVLGIIFTVLYVLLALQVRKGKSWARIVTWVIAGLSVLSGLSSFAQPAPGLSRLLQVVVLLLDVAIIVLLAARPSNEYFRRRS